MSKQHSGTYKVPTESKEDRQRFKQICLDIKSIQQKLSTNPNLIYSDINGFTMRIVQLRNEARHLNQKFRLRRDVP